MARSFFHRLFGESRDQEYLTDDIRSVSISCGHMNYSHSYSFYLRKEESGWLLDADYAADTGQPHTAFEECHVTEEDAKELLSIVQEQDVTGKLRRYKKPKIKVQIADGTAYYTSVLFTDGEQLGAATRVSNDLINGFCRLAGKYAGTVPETVDTE